MKTVVSFTRGASRSPTDDSLEDCDPLLYELVAHLRKNRNKLRREWMRRMEHVQLLRSLSRNDVAAVANSVYDGYVQALAIEGLEGLRTFLQQLPDRLSLCRIKSHEALGLVYLLRDVLGRSLFREFRHFEGRRAEKPIECNSEENRRDWSSAFSPDANSLEAV